MMRMVGVVILSSAYQQASTLVALSLIHIFPKLLWVHLTQTFVSLGVDILVFYSISILVDECLALLLCIAIDVYKRQS